MQRLMRNKLGSAQTRKFFKKSLTKNLLLCSNKCAKGDYKVTAEERRAEIIKALEQQKNPLSATKLAEAFSVSRQIIVGDIALLRAANQKIISTARGYMLDDESENVGYKAKVACFHKPGRTKEELYTIVDLGGAVLDVIVEHEIYGDISATLNLYSRADIDGFINQYKHAKAKLLTDLTNGVHLHTVLCKDEGMFLKIKEALKEKELLYNS